MFPSYFQLRHSLTQVIDDKQEQGHVTDGLKETLADVPDSYDVLAVFAERLAILPRRDDWPYVEPNDWAGIAVESDPDRPLGPLPGMPSGEASARIEAAFYGSVCGCILGKPLEFNPTLVRLQAILEGAGEWSLRDYVSERVLDHGAPAMAFWNQTYRERLSYVMPDDDINYTVLGMLNLEQHGADFTQEQLKGLWLHHLTADATFGPERAFLVKAALDTLGERQGDPPLDEWVSVLNPGDEQCGAMIRADAYGYACLGNPSLAAELAWRDASMTHRRTGIYGAIFAAAAVAAAPAFRDPLDVFAVALQFVPQRSRFYAIASDSLDEVAAATDWLDGYARIHAKYGAYGHCRVFQETGTLINTLRFAESVGDGICKQVMQGSDTDSYGATAGSILGAYFGPGHLEERWIAPFQDRFQTSLAWFRETSLSGLARRMGELPARIRADPTTLTL